MAYQQGLIQLDGDPFLYQEQNEIDGYALSAALGINSISGLGYSTWTLTVSSSPGANPSVTFPILSIDPVAGNVIWVPGSLFFISGNFAVSGTTSFTGNIGILDNLNDASGPEILFQKNRASAIIHSGDSLGIIEFSGYDGTQYVVGASVTSTSSGTIGVGRIASNLVFSTHPDSASGVSPVTRMTIGSTGDVTIASPDSGTGLTISGGGLNVTGTTVLNTPLGIGYGGTGTSTTPATDGLIYYNGTSYTSLTNGTTGQILVATTSAAPSWTSTVPGAVDSITGTANQITASASTGAVTLSIPSTFIAPGSIASTSTITSGTGLTVTTGGATITAGGLTVTAGNTTLTPLNAAGMVVNSSAGLLSTAATTHYAVQVGSAGGQLTSLSTGTANQILQSGGGSANPAWTTATYPATAATGSIIYASGTNTLTTLAAGTTGYVLTMGASVPAWSAAASSGITTLDGDSGSATGSTVTISGVSGVITTTGSGASIALTTPNIHIVTADHSTYVGVSAGNGSSGGYNASFGETALGSLTSGNRNTAIGFGAGAGTTSGTYNTWVGLNAAQYASGGGSTYNISIGAASGANLTSGSSNIYLNDAAPGNESNVLRIGSGTGTGNQQLNEAFISGIQGATLAGTPEGIVQVDSNDQLAGTQNPSITGTYTTTGGNLALPTTSSTAGQITIGGTTFLNNINNATFIGSSAGNLTTTAASRTVGVGYLALTAITSGDRNTAIGYRSGSGLTTGNRNTLLGEEAGQAYTSSESDNIQIGYIVGVAGESHVLRIGGATGTSQGQINSCYICGIQGATLAGTLEGIVQVDSNNQLAGTQNPSITGTYTTTGGNLALPTTSSTAGQITINSSSYFHGYGTNNVFAGPSSGNFSLTGTGNTCYGHSTGNALSGGINNTYIGNSAGAADAGSTAGGQTAVGRAALTSYTGSGASIPANVAVGNQCLEMLLTGLRNTAIGGYQTGENYTGAESDNILIGYGVSGTTSETNTLRIGVSTGSGSGQLNKAFIQGITGISVTGSAVIVNSSGQLGVTVSSERYKDNIEDMGDTSSRILELRPVTFNYIYHPDKRQVGLIAEEVLDIMPDLVVYNEDGDVESVKYHELPVLLLNELQKMAKRIAVLESELFERSTQFSRSGRAG